jgi:hypothetical protein
MLAAGNGDVLAFLIPFAIMGLVALVAIILASRNHRQRIASLRAIAERWSGRVHDGGMFGQPHAELQIKGISARLQFTKVGKQSFTELTIHFPDPTLRLEIYPQTVFHQVRKLLGMQDIEVGIRSFDDAFIIQGNSPFLIREYLSLEAQYALVALTGFTFFHNLHLNIGGSTLRVTKQGQLTSAQDLTQYVILFESLFNALLYTRTVGIEFLPTTIPTARPDSHCQVCGEGLQGNIVYCASCGTPHHLDCWQYVGHCSVYACGQQRYRA